MNIQLNSSAGSISILPAIRVRGNISWFIKLLHDVRFFLKRYFYSAGQGRICRISGSHSGVMKCYILWDITPYSPFKSITVAAWSKAWHVFARSKAGIVCSNPTQGMDVCLRLFCVCAVVCVGSGLASGWSPVQGVLPTVLRLRNLSETKCLTDALRSKWEQQE
jgi:hypothetical protein